MSLAKDIDSLENVAEEIVVPPTNLWSDEPPLESDRHREQMDLLIDCLNWWWRDRTDFYVSGNLTIYYSPEQIKRQDFRGPDFFVVLGTERRPRKSWVVWGENGRYPNLIVELLSQSTAAVDRGLKKQIYQDIFRTPDYFLFDPETLELAGFHLLDGQYQELIANEKGWLWSQQLELYLGIHQGKLRFFTANDEQLVLTEGEDERRQKELAEQKAERLAAKLRELGVDPDDL
ncbi:Uma2 family endonuclease [Aerosakkonemataceae cyanobacterium BLCC-F50]|uniref:Uma2 family endonuclease n=1 Tax=Floridaenema flaviceps BLCC-F50 TaxID=3153642 RepID=A0ABV4XP35_9CYAN